MMKTLEKALLKSFKRNCNTKSSMTENISIVKKRSRQARNAARNRRKKRLLTKSI